MKKSICSLFAFSFLFLFSGLGAENNTNSIPTSVDQAVIEILTGVKSAGAEIYSTSKIAAAQSVDFLKSEAPDVFRQFLIVHMIRNICYLLTFASISIVFFFLANKLNKYANDPELRCSERDNAGAFKIVCLILGTTILIVNFSVNVPDIFTIWLAPKIYMIEYVVNHVRK